MTTPDITDRLRATPRSDIREVMNDAAAEIERLRLTDAEREAVEQVIDAANGEATAEPWAVASLRGLLERTAR